jgi:hypothetical protein
VSRNLQLAPGAYCGCARDGDAHPASQNEGAFSFEPAWSFLHHDDPFLTGETSLPHPLVADLNGDGRLEVRRSAAWRAA